MSKKDYKGISYNNKFPVKAPPFSVSVAVVSGHKAWSPFNLIICHRKPLNRPVVIGLDI